MTWPPADIFLVAKNPFALVFLKSDHAMSTELLFANTVDISGKRGYAPVCVSSFTYSHCSLLRKRHALSVFLRSHI